MRRERVGPSDRAPSVKSHIWRSVSAVNGFFENFSKLSVGDAGSKNLVGRSEQSGKGEPNLQEPDPKFSRVFNQLVVTSAPPRWWRPYGSEARARQHTFSKMLQISVEPMSWGSPAGSGKAEAVQALAAGSQPAWI